ncbi:unnamed protein product [Closterium sp. NIES-64]|nr:unnamed protein product [Closterium sp. NIES-64]
MTSPVPHVTRVVTRAPPAPPAPALVTRTCPRHSHLPSSLAPALVTRTCPRHSHLPSSLAPALVTRACPRHSRLPSSLAPALVTRACPRHSRLPSSLAPALVTRACPRHSRLPGIPCFASSCASLRHARFPSSRTFPLVAHVPSRHARFPSLRDLLPSPHAFPLVTRNPPLVTRASPRYAHSSPRHALNHSLAIFCRPLAAADGTRMCRCPSFSSRPSPPVVASATPIGRGTGRERAGEMRRTEGEGQGGEGEGQRLCLPRNIFSVASPASPLHRPCFHPPSALLPPSLCPASPLPMPCFPPPYALLPPSLCPASPLPMPCFPPPYALLPPSLCPASPLPQRDLFGLHAHSQGGGAQVQLGGSAAALGAISRPPSPALSPLPFSFQTYLDSIHIRKEYNGRTRNNGAVQQPQSQPLAASGDTAIPLVALPASVILPLLLPPSFLQPSPVLSNLVFPVFLTPPSLPYWGTVPHRLHSPNIPSCPPQTMILQPNLLFLPSSPPHVP